MVNWRGAVARLGTGPWLLIIGTVATLAALAVTWAAGAGRQLAAAAAFIATPLVLPHANQHEAVLAAFGVVLAVGAAGEWRTRLTVGAVATHAILWAGPAMPAEASAWMLFAAELVWLTVVAVVAVRTRSMEPARSSSQGLSQVA
jgi:hypothetical protein